MSDNISSNVLFHFTRSMGDLKDILEFGFSPRYCPEYTLDHFDTKAVFKRHHPKHAIAMVCFCDLPLNLIKKHLDEYGGFGIGLQKTWGTRHGVEPVFYTHSRGQTRQPMFRLANRAAKGDDAFARDLDLLAAYTKPYQGHAWRKKRIKSNVRFYDEREWRFVPVKTNGAPLFLPWNGYGDISKRNAFQKRLAKYNTLRVTPADIQYLVVPYDKDERNILEMHKHLKHIYRRNKKDVILATTAIMTDDCIRQDA